MTLHAPKTRVRKSVREVSSAILLLALAPGASAPTASGAVATALFHSGQQLPGAPPAHIVSEFWGGVACTVNHQGGYAFHTNVDVVTSPGVVVHHIWGNANGGPGTVLQSTCIACDPVSLNGIYDEFGISNDGSLAYSAYSGAGSNQMASSIWKDQQPLFIEGQAVPGLPGFRWKHISQVGMTANGRPYWNGTMRTEPNGPDASSGIFIGAQASPLLLAGQQIPGLPAPLGIFSYAHGSLAVSALGNHFVGAAPLDEPAGRFALVKDGHALQFGGSTALGGEVVPPEIGGLPGEQWVDLDAPAVTESGRLAFLGQTTSPVDADSLIVIDGQIVYREGQEVDGYRLVSSPWIVTMNEQGDLAFIWKVLANNTSQQALFLNGRLLLMEKDPLDLDGDGTPEPNSTLSSFYSYRAGLALGDRDANGDVHVYFCARVYPEPDTINAGLVMKVNVEPCPADLDDDGQVAVSDLLLVISNWGEGFGNIADITGDGSVDVDDLLTSIANWGPCS